MQESPIFTKTFDMLAWLLPATLKFPREHRFVLAKRAQNSAFNFYEAIVAALLGKKNGSASRRTRQHLVSGCGQRMASRSG